MRVESWDKWLFSLIFSIILGFGFSNFAIADEGQINVTGIECPENFELQTAQGPGSRCISSAICPEGTELESWGGGFCLDPGGNDVVDFH